MEMRERGRGSTPTLQLSPSSGHLPSDDALDALDALDFSTIRMNSEFTIQLFRCTQWRPITAAAADATPIALIFNAYPMLSH